jgi:NAD+ synthase (glutamine-hydrolysing)
MSFRVALCQIDTVPGDVPGNAARIRAAAAEAEGAGADVALFPELALVGYLPRDLFFRRRLYEASEAALRELAAASGRTGLVVGCFGRNPGRGRPFTNDAALLADGRVVARVSKSLLPAYDVFDEARYFEPAKDVAPVDFRGRRLGLMVCEDLWSEPVDVESPGYAHDPAARLVAAGAEFLLNVSASPFHLGKARLREETVAAAARRFARPTALVNLVGGNDDVLFDGRSVVADAQGRVVARGAAFDEGVTVVDLDALAALPAVAPPPADDDVDELRRALVLGLRDYAAKCEFGAAHLGLSGGIDSAVVLALAVEAVGEDRVRGFALPSRFSSEGSRKDAFESARRLGVRCDEIAIDPVWTAASAGLEAALGAAPFGLTEENLQSRARGMLLMGVANRTGSLLLTTGNKSELAVGYGTLYGDLCGGFAPISDVYKTDVYRLARRIAETDGTIPEASITKPPSAELRPNQTDQDSLPPYDVLDGVLRLHLEGDLGARDIAARGFDETTVRRVLRMVARAEFKRRQAPPGLRVTRKAFGQGRRMPIAASGMEWLG